MSYRVLIVDDDTAMCEMLQLRLRKRGFWAEWRTMAEEALFLLEQEDFDVVVTDLNMGGMNGIELCGRIGANRPNVPVVVITAFGSLDTAVAAIRAGAYDFITKPFEIEELVLSLERAIQHRMLREEVKRLRQAVTESNSYDNMLGASAGMKQIFNLIDKVAPTDASVLITGESGTGKDLVARALHNRSPRKGRPMVALSCAALPEALLESELFGHKRGAFTDAKNNREGLFMQAHGGTLFLDEIGDMPLSLQPKLLRALEERAARPIGGNAEVPFNIRLVAATNRDLASAVDEGQFREDLYFRINVVNISLPPLRSRGSDTLLLAQHFIDHFATRAFKAIKGISTAAAKALLAYSWPGNIRELRNCMERAVALAEHDMITMDDLNERVRNYQSSHIIVAGVDPAELIPMEEVERRYIARVLEAVSGNKTLAAKILGFDRRTLYRKLDRYGIAGDPILQGETAL